MLVSVFSKFCGSPGQRGPHLRESNVLITFLHLTLIFFTWCTLLADHGWSSFFVRAVVPILHPCESLSVFAHSSVPDIPN